MSAVMVLFNMMIPLDILLAALYPMFIFEDCGQYRRAGSCGIDDDDVLCPILDASDCVCPAHEICVARGYLPQQSHGILSRKECQRYRTPRSCGVDDDDQVCGPIGYIGDILLCFQDIPEEKWHEECLSSHYYMPRWTPKRWIRKLLNFWRAPKKLCTPSPSEDV